MAKIRVALPGYNAQNDTNLDHFSLYSDVDNVLIKRKLTGAQTISGGGYPTQLTIAHDLNYIPFYMVYHDFFNSGVWRVLNNQYNSFEAPPILAGVDSGNLNIWNFYNTDIPVAYDIFYDDMSLSGSPSIVEGGRVLKVARPNKNALTSKNPNDFILQSDLNNFKILKHGNASGTIPTSTGKLSIAHGFTGTTPYKYFCFIKMPDGKVVLTGSINQYSYDESTKYIRSDMDSTNINVYASNTSDISVSVYYLIYGTGKEGMLENTPPVLAVAKQGCDVLTETNPDNFNFHSKYPTLKYYDSRSYSMTVSQTTVYTIAHNLGYTPFFIGFVNDLVNFIPNAYAIAPYYWGRTPYPQPPQDIGSFVYADANNIYLKAYYQPGAVGLSNTFTFYYKIFKNNLNL